MWTLAQTHLNLGFICITDPFKPGFDMHHLHDVLDELNMDINKDPFKPRFDMYQINHALGELDEINHALGELHELNIDTYTGHLNPGLIWTISTMHSVN